MRIFCAIVGVRGPPFSVKIDEDDTVDELQDAIKKKCANDLKNIDARHLLLLLAKKDKGRGAWATRREVQEGLINAVTDTRDYKDLPYPDMKLRSVGLVSGRLGEVTYEEIIAGLGPVHVLVMPPKTLRIGIDEHAEIFSSYRDVADHLKDSDEVGSLSKLLADVRVEGENTSTPFVVLENSSGTGKTQMAFNLQARGECDVFYTLCTMSGECGREQSVYNAYAERTATFLSCVRSDLEAMERHPLGNPDSLGTVDEIRGNLTLALYGFILAAVRGSGICFRGVRRAHVQAELRSRADSGAKPFVFFLDEFPHAGGIKIHGDNKAQRNHENSLRLMRNVFRSFDLAVVLSSSNGTARKLIAISERSRGSGSCIWCVVFPSLPRVYITGDYGVPKLLMDIIRHSRPLFARIALEYVQANPYNDSYNLNDYLNVMTGTLATRFKAMKKQTTDFKMGQLCLLLCTSYKVAKLNLDDVVGAKVNIIDGHFARLSEQSTFELYLDANGLRKDNKRWKCCSVMPPPQEDMLLHLTMTGGPIFRTFNEPLCTVMSTIRFPFYYDNTVQLSNDGIRLETLTAGAIVLASHAEGFGGVAFPTFLGELLFELGVSERHEMVQLLQDVEDAGWTQIVPFLSPPNEEWPEWLNDSSMRFGNLYRTRNHDRIDFRTIPNIISGECSAVALPVIEDILKRVPANTTIHLVVVNSLQNKYFTTESWGTFVREQSLQNVDFFRISKGSMLQEIEGMRNQSNSTMATADRLVLFIDREKN